MHKLLRADPQQTCNEHPVRRKNVESEGFLGMIRDQIGASVKKRFSCNIIKPNRSTSEPCNMG